MLPLLIQGIVRTAVQGLDAEMPLRYNDTLFEDIDYYLPSRAKVLQSQASCHTMNKEISWLMSTLTSSFMFVCALDAHSSFIHIVMIVGRCHQITCQ